VQPIILYRIGKFALVECVENAGVILSDILTPLAPTLLFYNREGAMLSTAPMFSTVSLFFNPI